MVYNILDYGAIGDGKVNDAGAVLKASDDLDDYAATDVLPDESAEWKHGKVPSYVNCEYDGKPRHYFIYAKDAEHVQVTGFGKIDGSEEIFHGQEGRYHIEGISGQETAKR